MRKSGWTPSIVPLGDDQDVYLVVDDFEGWSRDVSENIARELRRRSDLQLRDVPSSIQDFVERHEGSSRQLTLRLSK
jgi:hypothetical protein